MADKNQGTLIVATRKDWPPLHLFLSVKAWADPPGSFNWPSPLATPLFSEIEVFSYFSLILVKGTRCKTFQRWQTRSWNVNYTIETFDARILYIFTQPIFSRWRGCFTIRKVTSSIVSSEMICKQGQALSCAMRSITQTPSDGWSSFWGICAAHEQRDAPAREPTCYINASTGELILDRIARCSTDQANHLSARSHRDKMSMLPLEQLREVNKLLYVIERRITDDN